jgi:hypothetical protein
MNILATISILLLSLSHVVSLKHKCKSNSDLKHYYYDSCEQRCECKLMSYGTYGFKCFREREDYACMSQERKQRLHQAILDVSRPTDPLYATTQAFIEKHSTGFPTVHTDQWFLHFHRAYLTEFEDILRQKDCRITLPYWSFSQRPMDPYGYLPFTQQGMGDNGDCVVDGPFASWIPADKTTCLARNFAEPPVLPTFTQLNQIISLAGADFVSLANMLQYSYHNGVHVTIGGDAMTTRSPNDPLFFLLHANIDRVWNLYQNMNTNYFNNYPFLDDPIPYTNPSVRPSDVNSLEATGIRYVLAHGYYGNNQTLPTCAYVQCQDSCYLISRIETTVMGCPPSDLCSIRQNAPKTLTSSQQTAWLRMMATNKTQRREMREFLKRSVDQCETLTSTLTEIVDEPLFCGIDATQIVTVFGLDPDCYPVDNVCGIPETTPSPTIGYRLPSPTPYWLPPTPYFYPTPYYFPPSPPHHRTHFPTYWYGGPPPTPEHERTHEPTREYQRTKEPTKRYEDTPRPTPVYQRTPQPTMERTPQPTMERTPPPTFRITLPIFEPSPSSRSMPPTFRFTLPVFEPTPSRRIDLPPIRNPVLEPTPSQFEIPVIGNPVFEIAPTPRFEIPIDNIHVSTTIPVDPTPVPIRIMNPGFPLRSDETSGLASVSVLIPTPSTDLPINNRLNTHETFGLETMNFNPNIG